jgi:hypothetical protein
MGQKMGPHLSPRLGSFALASFLPTVPFPSPSPSPQQANMDRASQVLAQGTPPGVRNTYRALAEHSGVARSTLYYRALGRRSKEQKAQSQQYLTPCEEKAVVNFLLQMAEFEQPVRIKHIPSLAFSVARQRSTNKPPKPPGRNWARAFEKRHPEPPPIQLAQYFTPMCTDLLGHFCKCVSSLSFLKARPQR